MNFLQPIDLETAAFQQFFDQDNSTDKEAILNNIEQQNIALVKSKLNGKYDTAAIFNASGNDRHWLIVKILVKLVVYDFFRRNAARKVPKDIREEWEWAMDLLEKIKAGKETPDGLPPYTDADGNTNGVLIGNKKNDKFYI
jgi:DNA-binding GntR family transcriptional regulator